MNETITKIPATDHHQSIGQYGNYDNKIGNKTFAKQFLYRKNNFKVGPRNSFTIIENHTFMAVPEPNRNSPPVFTSFLIPNANYCSSHRLDIIVYSHSAVDNFDLRLAVRNTWGSRVQLERDRAALVFILGKSLNQSIQLKVVEESLAYGDIVQAEFIDDYYNLTYKAFMSIQWLKIYCTAVPIVVKTDDDIFLDIESVLTLIKHKMKPRSVICKMYYRNPILRNPETCGKWCAEESDFPNRKYYPKHCEGLIYAFDGSIVKELSIVMKHTPFYRIEDVWVGVNFSKLRHLFQNDINHYIAGVWKTVWNNYMEKNDIKTKTIAHIKGENKADILMKLWNLLTNIKQSV